jgi:predicted nuclease of predicted toxin-antitoxin system
LKFLVDAQLPPGLAQALRDIGHHADHVCDVGLLRASDDDILRFAIENGCAIISKDEDFAPRHRKEEPKVVVIWVRIGNSSRQALLERFIPLFPNILALIEDGETLIEIR